MVRHRKMYRTRRPAAHYPKRGFAWGHEYTIRSPTGQSKRRWNRIKIWHYPQWNPVQTRLAMGYTQNNTWQRWNWDLDDPDTYYDDYWPAKTRSGFSFGNESHWRNTTVNSQGNLTNADLDDDPDYFQAFHPQSDMDGPLILSSAVPTGNTLLAACFHSWTNVGTLTVGLLRPDHTVYEAHAPPWNSYWRLPWTGGVYYLSDLSAPATTAAIASICDVPCSACIS